MLSGKILTRRGRQSGIHVATPYIGNGQRIIVCLCMRRTKNEGCNDGEENLFHFFKVYTIKICSDCFTGTNLSYKQARS